MRVPVLVLAAIGLFAVSLAVGYVVGDLYLVRWSGSKDTARPPAAVTTPPDRPAPARTPGPPRGSGTSAPAPAAQPAPDRSPESARPAQTPARPGDARPAQTPPRPASPGAEPPGTVPATPPVFRVQVGAFLRRENAEAMAQRLRSEGYDALITGASPYKVQVGGFGQRAEAERLAEDLRARGYEVFVTQERRE